MKVSAKKVIAAKLEVTYGTDPTPDGTNGILCSNISLTPLAGSVAKRQRAHATYGADKHTLLQEYRTVSFDVELAGAGAAGDAPLYGPLLRACGLSETISEDTKVEYAPISSSQESVTIWFWWDGLLHKLNGARGTVSFKLNGGALPMMSFAFTGLFGAADSDASALDVESGMASFIDAIEVNKANTATATLMGTAVTLESLQVDLGNQAQFRDRPNAAYVALTNREVTGNISFEAQTVATKAWVSTAKTGTTGALAIVHGTAAGNIIKIDGSKAQLEQPSYNEGDGIVIMQSAFGLKRTAGDDEFKLTVQ
jgi:hypothetical protein